MPVAILKLLEMIYMLPKIKNGLVQIFAHGFDFFHYKAFTVVIAFLTSDESGSLADVLEILV